MPISLYDLVPLWWRKADVTARPELTDEDIRALVRQRDELRRQREAQKLLALRHRLFNS